MTGGIRPAGCWRCRGNKPAGCGSAGSERAAGIKPAGSRGGRSGRWVEEGRGGEMRKGGAVGPALPVCDCLWVLLAGGFGGVVAAAGGGEVDRRSVRDAGRLGLTPEGEVRL